VDYYDYLTTKVLVWSLLELVDEYTDIVNYLIEHNYTDVICYTTSIFF
jgi:hypothetical protein